MATKSVETKFVMTTKMFCALLACVPRFSLFFSAFLVNEFSRFTFFSPKHHNALALSRLGGVSRCAHTSALFFLLLFSLFSPFSSRRPSFEHARSSSRWSRRNRRKQTVNQRVHDFQFPRRVQLSVPMQTSLRGNNENMNIDDGDCSPRRRRDGGVLVGEKVAGAVRNR